MAQQLPGSTGPHPLLSAVEQLADDPRLDRARTAVAAVAERVVPPGPRRDALQGAWQGSPLHPVLTDVTIGCWTSAFVLDLVGGRRGRTAARRLVGLGVLSALPTAASGLAEWADADEGSQRIGVAHAGANSVALACYALSWRARRRGHHLRGMALGLVGGGVATVGAHLGGHLTYERGVGVGREGRRQRAATSPAHRAEEPSVSGEGAPSDNTTLSAVVADYESAGFTTAFLIRDGGTITCRHCGQTSPARQFSLHSLRRLEGASDPADMVAVAAVHCPSCEARGLLVLPYGPEAGEDETLVYLALDDHRQDQDGVPSSAGPTEGQERTGPT